MQGIASCRKELTHRVLGRGHHPSPNSIASGRHATRLHAETVPDMFVQSWNLADTMLQVAISGMKSGACLVQTPARSAQLVAKRD
eukprot:8819058-Karenia_brevis.AAC.1